jgi:hypothetical protein
MEGTMSTLREERNFWESFEGPNGKAELFEVIGTDTAHPGLENVTYEIVFKGESQTRKTVGEASILACELTGDERFQHMSFKDMRH